MRDVGESKLFSERVDLLFASHKAADEAVLFAVTWELARANLKDNALFPVVGKLATGELVRVTQTKDSYFATAMLVSFTVNEQGSAVTMHDIVPANLSLNK